MKTLDTHRDLVQAWLLAQGGMTLPQASLQPAQGQAPASLAHASAARLDFSASRP